MIQSFADDATRDVWNGKNTKAARTLPQSLWNVIRRKLTMVEAAVELLDLQSPPSNKLHALKNDQKGRHAIWVNTQYRITFRFDSGNVHDVRCEDYH